ncbi:MAG: DNA repair exonuclease [Planctomycetes bacterium]|nr:DNA repair exonuclease [Planctomycetota bacterium]
MKFLHTADWQIGMRARHVGPAGGRVREERLQAARRVMEAARDRGAEFVLVAGDTFEDNAVGRVLVQKVADILAEAGKPVYVIPGNHDPLVPGSVWGHPVWSDRSDVHVLRENSPIEIPGGVLYPCPARSKQSGEDPTAWIPREGGAGIRIGLAHGTVGGIHREEPDYPIPRDAATRAALDYLALGHWHSTSTYPSPEGPVRMAYSGTHESTGFGERDSGNALLVEIDAPGATPRVTTLRTGVLSWRTIEEDLREPGDVARLRARVEEMGSPADTLLEVRIRGVLWAADREELLRLEDLVASRFLFGRIEASGLNPAPADENWLSGIPPGILREAAVRLREYANPGATGPRPEGASPQMASRALLELYTHVSEQRR